MPESNSDIPFDRRDRGRHTQNAVLKELVLRGPLSRTEIAANLAVSGATITRIVRPLLDCGLVREIDYTDRAGPPRKLGRPSVHLDVAADGGQVLGIDLSLSFQTVTLANLKNRAISKTALELSSQDRPDTVIHRLADACLRLIDKYVENRGRLLGGFAVLAGTVDRRNDRTVRSRYLGWQDVQLGARLSDILSLPIKVESLMTCSALAETRFGVARGRSDVLVAICGIRLVTSVMLDGRMVEGRLFPAGLIGFAPMLGEAESAVTVDQYASGLGVLLRMQDSDFDVRAMSISEQSALLSSVIGRDRDSDPAVHLPLAETGRALGRVLVQFVACLAPESLVIGGPLAGAPSFFAACREAIAAALGAENPIEIVGSSMFGPSSDRSMSCGLAIGEYLFERPIDPAILGDSAA